jgi:hypothetical protein
MDAKIVIKVDSDRKEVFSQTLERDNQNMSAWFRSQMDEFLSRENRRSQVNMALDTVADALENFVEECISSDQESQQELSEAWNLIWEIVRDNS